MYYNGDVRVDQAGSECYPWSAVVGSPGFEHIFVSGNFPENSVEAAENKCR